MVRLGKVNSDINIWGLTHNDYHKTLVGHGEWISIVANGNNPPSVSQYTRFQFYDTDTSYTIPLVPPTENNVYSNNNSDAYFCAQAIYEDIGIRNFTWGGGATFPAQSDGTWYLYCYGSYDVATGDLYRGRGNYGVSKTETPIYSEQKGGYYSANNNRVLAAFTSSSGVVTLTHVYNGGKVFKETNGNLSLKNTTEDADINFYVNNGGANSVAISIKGATQNIITSVTGKVATGGETAPDVDAGGLCLNNNNEIGFNLTLKNNGVNHGITDYNETDTFGAFRRISSLGGILIRGLSEDVEGVNISSYATNSNTAIASTADAPIYLQCFKKNGTGKTNFSAGDNLFLISDNGSVRFIVQQDGDLYTDSAGGAGGSGDAVVRYYDDENDIMLARAAQKAIGHQEIDGNLTIHRERLEELGIMKNGFISHKKMMALNLGSVNQLFNMMKKLAEKLGVNEDELLEMARG